MAKITSLLGSISANGRALSGVVIINCDLAAMADQLQRAEARIVLERLLAQRAVLDAELAAQQAIITAPSA